MDLSDPRNSTMQWSHNIHKGIEKDLNNAKETFSISKRIIEKRLSEKVTEKFQAERRKEIEKEYTELIASLNPIEALQKHIKDFKEYNNKKKKRIEEIEGKAAELLKKQTKKLFNEEYVSSKEWDTEDLKAHIDWFKKEGKRLIDTQRSIASLNFLICNDTYIIIDCSWKKYFDKTDS